MDIVYLVKKGCYEELRFSLRSLKNIEHNKVFLIGGLPGYASDVYHINHEDNGDKFNNVKEKHKIITQIEELDDDFIYMNDDFYFLIQQEPENYIIGTLEEHLQYIIKRDRGNLSYYQQGLLYIKDKFGPNALSYEAHTPMIMNKKKLKKLIKKYPDYIATSLRSLYGNEYKIKAKMLENTPNYKGYSENLIDCKCYYHSCLQTLEGQKLLSSENTLIGREYKKFMENIFPHGRKYENVEFITVLRDEKFINIKRKNSIPSDIFMWDASNNIKEICI